jgi:hypothetical protein
MTETICDACGRKFWPERRTRRFCSDSCRVNAHRAKPIGAPPVALALQAPNDTPQPEITHEAPPCNAKNAQPRALKKAKNYPGGVRVVPDETYPNMWRVRQPDGTLSDMVNRARAWDAARLLTDPSY